MLITALHQAGLATLTHTPSPMKFLSEILERPSHERPFCCWWWVIRKRVPWCRILSACRWRRLPPFCNRLGVFIAFVWHSRSFKSCNSPLDFAIMNSYLAQLWFLQPMSHPTQLTHLNASGEAHMVDVSDKADTARTAAGPVAGRVNRQILWLLFRQQPTQGRSVCHSANCGYSGS